MCDIFNPPGSAKWENGLRGEVRYVYSNQFINVDGMVKNEYTKVPGDLYLTSLNVPTQMWDRGFSVKDGSLVRKENGEVLNEYFGLNLQGSIALGPNDPEGLYQFALISDDDAMVKFLDPKDQKEKVLLRNGGGPTKISCTSFAVELKKDRKIPISVNYVQQPRFHIAMMLMWKKVGSENPSNDPSCFIPASNEIFFDPTQKPSVPNENFRTMERNGWKVLGPDNYFVQSGRNLCSADPLPAAEVYYDRNKGWDGPVNSQHGSVSPNHTCSDYLSTTVINTSGYPIHVSISGNRIAGTFQLNPGERRLIVGEPFTYTLVPGQVREDPITIRLTDSRNGSRVTEVKGGKIVKAGMQTGNSCQ
jgi:hypothetical protein